MKADWERTVGGAVGGNRRLVPPRIILLEDAECCDGRIMDPSSQRTHDESRLYRERAPVNHASLGVTVYGTERNHAADYGEPETDCYADRDPWCTQSQLGRPCPETVWGYRTAMSRSVPAPNAVIEPTRPNVTMSGEESTLRGAGRHPVPLDAPDVALREQRLLAYGERLWREETETANPVVGRSHHPGRPRRPIARLQWPEAAERQMPAPLAAGGMDDIRMMGQPRPLQAEERIYVEPPRAPEIGRRPLDFDAGQPNSAQNERATVQPMRLRQEAPVYEDH